MSSLVRGGGWLLAVVAKERRVWLHFSLQVALQKYVHEDKNAFADYINPFLG